MNNEISDEDRTFFALKFGVDCDSIFDKWVTDEISLTHKEIEILAELMDDNFDSILSYRATIESYQQARNCL